MGLLEGATNLKIQSCAESHNLEAVKPILWGEALFGARSPFPPDAFRRTTSLQGRSVAEGVNLTSGNYCRKDKLFTLKRLICCPN